MADQAPKLVEIGTGSGHTVFADTDGYMWVKIDKDSDLGASTSGKTHKVADAPWKWYSILGKRFALTLGVWTDPPKKEEED